MSKVRINDLARELEVKSRSILDALTAVGVTEKKTHSSSIEEDEAEKVRGYFNGGNRSSTAAKPQVDTKPKFDLSKVSKPGDALRAILERKQAEAAIKAAPPRPAAVAAPPPSPPLRRTAASRRRCCAALQRAAQPHRRLHRRRAASCLSPGSRSTSCLQHLLRQLPASLPSARSLLAHRLLHLPPRASSQDRPAVQLRPHPQRPQQSPQPRPRTPKPSRHASRGPAASRSAGACARLPEPEASAHPSRRGRRSLRSTSRARRSSRPARHHAADRPAPHLHRSARRSGNAATRPSYLRAPTASGPRRSRLAPLAPWLPARAVPCTQPAPSPAAPAEHPVVPASLPAAHVLPLVHAPASEHVPAEHPACMPGPGETPGGMRPAARPGQRRGGQRYEKTKEGPMKGFQPPPRFGGAADLPRARCRSPAPSPSPKASASKTSPKSSTYAARTSSPPC